MKQTVQTLQAMKERGEKIAMLTCYDYTMAKLMDAAGTDAGRGLSGQRDPWLFRHHLRDHGGHDPPHGSSFQRRSECPGRCRYAVPVLSDFGV